jgi:hypothetical protein
MKTVKYEYMGQTVELPVKEVAHIESHQRSAIISYADGSYIHVTGNPSWVSCAVTLAYAIKVAYHVGWKDGFEHVVKDIEEVVHG